MNTIIRITLLKSAIWFYILQKKFELVIKLKQSRKKLQK